MTITDSPAPHNTITQRLVEMARARGEQPALAGDADRWPGRPLSYPELAGTLQAAAAGLAWRGLQPRDVVGVLVPDAASYTVAVHAIRAAGGVPSPICPGSAVPKIADQLTQCGARMLITGPPLAAAALAAADDSWVRQVISFGDEPDTVPFSSLLGKGSRQPACGGTVGLALLPYVTGFADRLSPVRLTHVDLADEMARLAATAPMSGQDVVIAAAPAGDCLAYSALLDLALIAGATIVAADGEDFAAAAREHGGTVAIVHPGTPRLADLQLTVALAR